MKIAFLTKFYEPYLAGLSQRHPQLSLKSYNDIHETLVNDHFQFYSSLIKNLRRQGHEAYFLSPATRILNEAWYKEKGRQLPIDPFTIIKDQVLERSPDLIFISSNFEFYGKVKSWIASQKIKTCAWISCPFPDDLDLGHIRTVFTLFPPHHDYFKKQGLNSILVRAGFDASVIELTDNLPHVTSKVSFVGGIGAFHRKREAILRYLSANTKIDLYGYGFHSLNPLKNVLKQIWYRFAFTRNFKGQAWGLDMFNVLKGSEITLNIHGDIAEGHSVNMRLFEATGMGTLLITEDNPGIRELFVPGEEVVVFTDKKDALEKIRYYLSHPEERLKIASNGQKKTLTKYRYDDISNTFIEEFKRLLNEPQ